MMSTFQKYVKLEDKHKMATLTLELTEPLEQRIINFKSDPEKMKDANDFVNDLIEKACIDAQTRQLNPKQKSKLVKYPFNLILYKFSILDVPCIQFIMKNFHWYLNETKI